MSTLGFILISLIAALGPVAHATDIQCINGPYQKNTAFIDSLNASDDPLKNAYLTVLSDMRNIQSSSNYPDKDCVGTDLSKKQLDSLNDLARAPQNKFAISSEITMPDSFAKDFADSRRSPAGLIKKECIAAAMKRTPSNTSYTCNQNEMRSLGTAAGKNTQCVTDKAVDYMQFAVNNAIKCLSPDNPVDSQLIFKKINNETAFNPGTASRNGVGLVQLTSSAVNEMADPKIGKGYSILKEVANSQKPECNGFKEIAKKDLEKKPSLNSENYCPWISPSEGLARNLLYSVGYYRVLRDAYVLPLVASKKSTELYNNTEIVSDLTAIAYGPEGMDHAKWLLQQYRVGTKPNIKQLRAAITDGSVYLKSLNEKMKEVGCIKRDIEPSSTECKRMKFSSDELEGNTCVTSK